MEKNNQPNKNIFTGIEEGVLKFWEKNEIFEKSVNKEAPQGEYVFYDGPPFATGTPHYGHLVASLMKDTVPRFWTMNGYSVQRRWGWDCHGLPIENIVEKELGTKSKKEIEENIGVEKFNALCRSKVFSYAEDWKKTIRRLGRWVDMDRPYRTLDTDFMESVWWAFKQLWDNGLVYKDYRSMYICPRCETTLSQSEVAEGYRDVKDLSVTVKFELVDEPGTFVLAWTTTPWTLPGNVALAVGKDIEYVKFKVIDAQDSSLKNGEIYILRTEYLPPFAFAQGSKFTGPAMIGKTILHHSYEGAIVDDIQNIKGSDLIGRRYKPLFDNYAKDEKLENRENGWKIYHGDFVTTEDGTGVVHIAPAFGEDDMNLGRQYNLPFVQHVAMDGTFKKEMGELAGLHVKPKDDVQATDVAIIKYLAGKNLLFAKEKYEHSYPHCWRCDTPLINYATSSWFVNITKMKDEMLKNAEPIHWFPEHIKAGRFGQWLEGARDWSVSRQRFWASCLPIWECACGAKKVIGSLEEFYRAANGQITKVILVRHGLAENNVKNIIYSGTDKYGLTDKGRQDIQKAAEKIKKEISGAEDKTVIFTSPVMRARESAEIIARETGTNFELSDGLREMDMGTWENCDEKELSRSNDLRKEYDKASAEEKWDFKRGGTGESSTDVAERVYAWFKDILKNYAGKIIIAVTHGDPVIDLIDKLKARSKKESALAWIGPEYPETGSVKIVYVNNATALEMDLHKDALDKINLTCDVCPGAMKRVPDVLDCWFESGSMPYAQMHYPFENRERFEKNFPAEFIAEGIDQTRCWFYYLHAIASGIKNNYAFKNVIVNGIVLAEDGKKMSKKLKNYPDPELILEKYGADALRYYLLTSPVMAAENLNFSEKGVADCLRKVNMILWNVYKFYEMYASENSPLERGGRQAGVCEGCSKNVLDQWIIARLNQLISEVSDGMKNYDLPRATRPIVVFIDDLSTWYIRRSRDRFKEEGEDKNSALATTKYILENLAKVMAPFTPFIAEELWQKVTGYNFTDLNKSVHLESFPQQRESNSDAEDVLSEMSAVRKIVELGLAKRDEAGMKVRQPLNQLSIVNCQLSIEHQALIKDELNVKNIVCKTGEGELSVELDTTMTPELLAEGAKRELVRLVNAERKNAGLTIGDKISLRYEAEGQNLKEVMEKFVEELKKDVLADEIISGDIDGGKEVEVNGEKMVIKINKI